MQLSTSPCLKNDPGGHFSQEEAPVPEKSPTSQGLQVLFEVAPAASLNVSLGQGVQSSLPPSRTAMYVPAPQSLQVLLPWGR